MGKRKKKKKHAIKKKLRRIAEKKYMNKEPHVTKMGDFLTPVKDL